MRAPSLAKSTQLDVLLMLNQIAVYVAQLWIGGPCMSHTYFYTLMSASRRGAKVQLQRPTTGVESARFPCWLCYEAVNKS